MARRSRDNRQNTLRLHNNAVTLKFEQMIEIFDELLQIDAHIRHEDTYDNDLITIVLSVEKNNI